MATATKCMSKMLKKELYEHCKKLTNENQKLQLFNNAQEQEINELKALYPHSQKEYIDIARNYSFNIQNDYICGQVDNPNRPRLFNANNELKICKENQCPKGELFIPFIKIIIHRDNEIKELEEKIKKQKYNCLIKYETDIKQKDISIELIQVKNQKLEKDLEYFQNKCEIMEKELIEEEEKTILFEMVQDLTEESGNKEDTIIKLEKDNKKLQESIVELEAVILSKPNIFYYSYDEEGHIFYDNIEDLVRNTPRIEDCYVYQGNVTEEVIKSNDFLGFSGTEIDYMVKL